MYQQWYVYNIQYTESNVLNWTYVHFHPFFITIQNVYLGVAFFFTIQRILYTHIKNLPIESSYIHRTLYSLG